MFANESTVSAVERRLEGQGEEATRRVRLTSPLCAQVNLMSTLVLARSEWVAFLLVNQMGNQPHHDHSSRKASESMTASQMVAKTSVKMKAHWTSPA